MAKEKKQSIKYKKFKVKKWRSFIKLQISPFPLSCLSLLFSSYFQRMQKRFAPALKVYQRPLGSEWSPYSFILDIKAAVVYRELFA